MIYKVWSISLCHNDPEIIRESLSQLQKTRDKKNVEMQIVMVDQHWPIDYEDCKLQLQQIAKENNAILLDPGKNLGLHDGFNWALDQLHIPDNAMVIGYDPDCYPVTQNWDAAMCEVFVKDQKIMWLSLWHQHSDREIITEKRAKKPELIAGIKVHELTRPAMNSVCGFRRGWLRAVGGLKEPSKWYGGLECAMWDDLNKFGKWVFLEDYKEIPYFQQRINPHYRTWKWKHAHEGYPHDFAEFMRLQYLSRSR